MPTSEIRYRIIRSNRRTVGIRILPDGEVVVRCPRRMTAAAVAELVESKSQWIAAQLAKRPSVAPLTQGELRSLAQSAKEVIPERVRLYASRAGVTYGRITIRNQRTRWGSCSSKGNLNFNCLLMLAPPEVLDYVVVHELCHRKEMNHSARFWAEVARVLPDYPAQRAWLKENGGALIRRMGR